jgi:TATA-box binding protein (TBP) (component of TFIID and TFIIIB)
LSSAAAMLTAATSPIVRNYKASFRTKHPLIRQIDALMVSNPACIKKHHNFAVIRSGFVYTAYFSGFVNVTKVQRAEELDDAVANFCSLLQLDKQQTFNISVDNITASGHFGHTVSLTRLWTRCRSLEDCQLSYKPHYFAGAFLKLKNCCTILIFSTGSYSIVGARNCNDIARGHAKAAALLL